MFIFSDIKITTPNLMISSWMHLISIFGFFFLCFSHGKLFELCSFASCSIRESIQPDTRPRAQHFMWGRI